MAYKESKDMMDTPIISNPRDDLKGQLDLIRKQFPDVANRVWSIFKFIKSPEKSIEKIEVRNEKIERELELELESLRARLEQKILQTQQLEREITDMKAEWEEKNTVYIEDVAFTHPYLRLPDEILRKMYKDQTDKLFENLPISGADKLSYAKKQMFLHIGFSEFHLLKSLTAKSLTELRESHFRFKIKRRGL